MGQTAWADGEQEPQWIPSVNVGFDTFEYDTSATVDNTIDPPRHSGTQSHAYTSFMGRFGAELMGPMLEGLPGRPRFFVRGGAQLSAFPGERIFRLGEIGTPEDEIQAFYDDLARDIARGCEDPDSRFHPCPTADAENFDGQGSEIEAEFLNPSWYAGLGVAFNVPVPSTDALLRIKPSVEYNVEKVSMSGRLTTVTETAPDEFEVHRSLAHDTTTDHSLGPGIELELVLFSSARPVTASIYLDARFLWLLNHSTTSFSDSASLVSYTVERDALQIRGGGGLRFSWMGSGGG
jgi:hypothetical protein